MLLALVPPPFILPSIGPVVKTITFLFVVQVLTVVTHSVCVDVDTMSLHVIVRPLAKIFAAVFPKIGSESINLVILPLAFISRAIGPGVFPNTFFLAHHVLSLVECTFWPGFKTLSILLVVFPVAFVTSSLHVCVNSVSICFVIKPCAIINITVGMKEFSFAAGLVELPLPFISRIVWPDHRATSVPQTAFPLTSVNSSGLIGVNSVFKGSIRLKLTAKSFHCFIDLKVLRLNFGC